MAESMTTIGPRSNRVRPGTRAAVVGSGFGGLAVAIRLAAAGAHTVLFEARDRPGGRAYVYEGQGFTFDAGPTVITAPQCLEELFAFSGRRMDEFIELLPVTPLYRLRWSDGDSFDYVADGATLLAQIGHRDRRDVEGYLRFLEYSRRTFHKGYEELAATPFLRLSDMVRVAPALLRLRADRSVYDTVARFVHDERVRQALSFHSLLVGGNPFETSAVYTLIHYLERKWGVFFPKGGTGALVRALARLFVELGGELRLSSRVTRVQLERQGKRAVHHVYTDGRERETFDLVVSNADLHHTYATLYSNERSARRAGRRLESLKWSMSLYVLYFGTDRVYPQVAHHTVLFSSRYETLCRDIFRGPALPHDFSLYLHAPTVTDPALAPPNCASFYVLSPVPHLGAANVDWDRDGEAYGNRILTALERELPDLRRHIVVRRHFTPRDFQRELFAYKGSAFSLAPVLGQSAWFRPHNRDPDIPGLYLVGAGTHPGAGIPGVVNSAKVTASLIANDFSPSRVPGGAVGGKAGQ